MISSRALGCIATFVGVLAAMAVALTLSTAAAAQAIGTSTRWRTMLGFWA